MSHLNSLPVDVYLYPEFPVDAEIIRCLGRLKGNRIAKSGYIKSLLSVGMACEVRGLNIDPLKVKVSKQSHKGIKKVRFRSRIYPVDELRCCIIKSLRGHHKRSIDALIVRYIRKGFIWSNQISVGDATGRGTADALSMETTVIKEQGAVPPSEQVIEQESGFADSELDSPINFDDNGEGDTVAPEQQTPDEPLQSTGKEAQKTAEIAREHEATEKRELEQQGQEAQEQRETKRRSPLLGLMGDN